MGKIFDDTHFLIVDTGETGHYSVAWMKSLTSRNGGRSTIKTPQDSAGTIDTQRISHIISATYDFAEYARAAELMVPVTSPQWLEDSELAHQRRNYRLYSPVPLPFMDRVVVCISDNLPEGDREMMYAGVRAFGGQYLDALSRYTTHLVAVDLSNNKSVVAANIKKKEGLEIKIVLPHWVDDCMRQQRHVDEEPYLLSDPVVLQTGKPNFKTYTASQDEEYALENVKSDVLKGKVVYLDGDYKLSERLVDALTSLVKRCGGQITTDFDDKSVNVYLGKYRQGEIFRQCCKASGIDVATLPWLYYVAMTKKYVSPLESQLLHFPVPEAIIPEFQNLRISVTGYSGDARHYLSQLIVAMGANFTKTLDSRNDFLVTAKASGEKYDAARKRWPSVKIVNHLWIEECFVKWKLLDASDKRYSGVDSAEQLLGMTHLLKQDLLKWIDDGSEALDVEDSLNEDNHNSISDHQNVASQDSKKGLESVTRSPTTSPDIDSDAAPTASNGTLATTEVINKIASTNGSQGQEDVVEIQETINVPTQVHGRAGRSAKKKAEMKLHSDMEDLNQYTSMSKSVRKMKDYMEELDRSVTTPKKKRESEEPTTGDPDGTPVKKKKTEATTKATPKKKNEKPVHMVAIMTGCEQDLVLNRAEIVKLSKVGIHVVNDTNSKRQIDTIIAPRVLRTEKFLISLSKAHQILHPSYLADVLKRIAHSETTWEELSLEFNIKDYYLDNVVPVKQINEELGCKGTASGLKRLLLHENGLVFDGLKLNLSTNLNGGAGLISGILEAHGLQTANQIKLTASSSKSNLVSNEDGKCILVAHKVRDKKLVSSLKDVTVVDWDWCVKSIFQGKLENYTKYTVGK